jgi:PAS domain S-box-containing protein
MARLRQAISEIDRDVVTSEIAGRARASAVLVAVRRVPAAVLIANDRGHYVDGNDRAVRLTGYSRAELLRMSVWQITPVERDTLGRRLWRDFLRRGEMSGVYMVRRKDGRLVRARYFALAHVLPHVHVSALIALPNRSARRTTRRKRPPA